MPTPDSRDRFRILALDGGGVRGTFTASFLAELEQMTGKRIAEYFDLVAGTSTGGIVALALGLGISPSEILDFYLKEGPTIFKNIGLEGLRRSALHWFRPKHPREPLRAALERVFGNRRMGASHCRLVIPSFDAVNGQVHVFKTAHHARLKQDYKVTAVDVALATSAAPTFFESYTNREGQRFIDGGVWANCPAATAIIESMTLLEQTLGNIDILSIGTTSSPFSVSAREARRGLWGWRRLALNLIMAAQSEAALSQAKMLVGERLFRVEPKVEGGRFSLDNSKEIGDLRALGISTARHKETEISKLFLNETVVPFRPFYTLN